MHYFTIILNHSISFENNNTINQELAHKDFYTMKNNTDRKKDDNNNITDFCPTSGSYF